MCSKIRKQSGKNKSMSKGKKNKKQQINTKKRKDKKAEATAAAAESKKADEEENARVYSTAEGVQYVTMDVAGGGLCTLLSVIILVMFAAGISCAEIRAAANSELTDDMKEYVQALRAVIVNISGDHFTFRDGEEFAEFIDVVHNPRHTLMTKEMWQEGTLWSSGYLDGRAAWFLAKFLGLDGLRIAKQENGRLVPCHAGGPIPF